MNSDEAFPESETIKTARLILEPFSEKYLTEKYIDWLNDPRVMRYSEQRHLRHTVESCRVYYKSLPGKSGVMWAVVRNESNDHIGNINAYVDRTHKTADIGILIGEEAMWGNGYATEAFCAVANYLFRSLGVRKITAGCISENKGMLRLMRRIGMVDDGCRKRHHIWEGKEVDLIHMALFEDKLPFKKGLFIFNK